MTKTQYLATQMEDDVAYMTMHQYHETRDRLVDCDGCTINGEEFTKYCDYKNNENYVWTMWDEPSRSGLQSYLTENDCIALGLIRTSPVS